MREGVVGPSYQFPTLVRIGWIQKELIIWCIHERMVFQFASTSAMAKRVR